LQLKYFSKEQKELERRKSFKTNLRIGISFAEQIRRAGK
jgi:hypothetical protein